MALQTLLGLILSILIILNEDQIDFLQGDIRNKEDLAKINERC